MYFYAHDCMSRLVNVVKEQLLPYYVRSFRRIVIRLYVLPCNKNSKAKDI